MRKAISVWMVMALLLSVLGCNQSGSVSKEDSKRVPDSSTVAQKEDSSEADVQGFTYPFPANADGSHVTVSMNKNDFVRADVPSYTVIDGKSYYFWDVLEEKTGIHIDFIGSESNAQSTSEAANLLIVSGEFPDIWRVNWINHPGGPTGAMTDGIILNLSENAEFCPNLMAYAQANADINKMIVNDDGDLYCFPFIIDCPGIGYVGTGPVIRSDWLEEQNMKTPVTIEDWTTALRVFKDQYNCTSGLSFESRWLWLDYAAASLTSAWQTAFPFYIMDGTVKFGPLEEGYRGFVQQMADWYAEGLLDPDFASVDKSTVQAKFANSESGITIQQDSNVENGLLANKGTGFMAAPLPVPVLKEGDPQMFGHLVPKYDGRFSLSVAPGKNQEAAMRLCDYMYSEEGQMLCAYGTEGITYTTDQNGEFAGFTDIITNNSQTEEAPSSIRSQFALWNNWASPQRDASIFKSDFIKGLVSVWRENDMEKHYYPAVTHTPEEVSLISEVYGDIETYCKESIIQFILGTQSMDSWDAFTERLKTLGMDAVISAKQEAYNRFNAR